MLRFLPILIINNPDPAATSMSQQQAISNQGPNLGTQPEDKLTPVKQLTKIFPDIEQQLCSRHSSLFGKLKHTFNKLYASMEPTHYVIVKGNTQIVGSIQDEVELSMGLENGIIILVSTTYPDADVYINGNHMDEELILTCRGNLSEGLYQMTEDIETIYQSALAGVAGLHGGIMYVHANIPEGFYNYRNSLLTALFISGLIVNGRLQHHSISDIINRISQTGLVEQAFLEKYFFDYENREFSLMVGSSMYKVPLNPGVKLLFCKLDLAQSDVNHSQKTVRALKNDKSKILQWLQKNYQVASFYEAFESEISLQMDELTIEGAANHQKVQYIKLIDSELKQLKALCEFSNHRITIEELLEMKWLLDSQIRNIYNEEILELVERIQERTRIQACAIVEGSYLVMAVERRRYTELICVLRQLLNRGELKSRSCFKIEEELVETRWSSDNEIAEKIFVSVPSKGIAVFDPSEAIWFD